MNNVHFEKKIASYVLRSGHNVKWLLGILHEGFLSVSQDEPRQFAVIVEH